MQCGSLERWQRRHKVSAVLHHIKLHPERGDTDTETYLGFALSDAEVKGTGAEGLWEQSETRMSTLYVITRCKPITPLLPRSDPLSQETVYNR